MDQLFDDLGSKELCQKQCEKDGRDCRFDCIIKQGKSIEACGEDYVKNTSAYDTCEEDARLLFNICMSECVYDDENCAKKC